MGLVRYMQLPNTVFFCLCIFSLVAFMYGFTVILMRRSSMENSETRVPPKFRSTLV